MLSGGNDIKPNGAQEQPQSQPSPARGKPSPWTADDETSLRRWWADGFTCSQISTGLGGRFSRNAVIGKVHRLGLDGRAGPILTTAEKEERRKRRNAEKYAWKLRNNYVPPSRRKVVEFISDEPPQPYDFLALTFDALQHGDCRYPRGEGSEIRFCGQPSLNGHSYCRHCYLITHQTGPRHPLPLSEQGDAKTRVRAGEGRAQPARSSFAFWGAAK